MEKANSVPPSAESSSDTIRLRQEKESALASIREKVDGFYTIHNAGRKDKNEKSFVDEGIKDTVVFLTALGFRTYDSCYGHPELTPSEDAIFFQTTPIVRIDTPFLADYQDETKNMADAERNEMQKQSIEIEYRSNSLLSEFYKDRLVAHEECRIVNERWYDDNCFRNKGEESIKAAQISIGPNDIHPLVVESRVEWDDFSRFLEQYYLAEN